MGHPMRIELTRAGLLVYLANHHTTRGALDIVAGVQQGSTLVPYLFIICLDYVLRTSFDKMKENSSS